MKNMKFRRNKLERNVVNELNKKPFEMANGLKKIIEDKEDYFED
jgi:hypothetical protein